MGNYQFEKMEKIVFKGRTLINKDDDFKLGFGDDVELNQDGQLVIKENKLQGIYISPEIISEKFKNLVASWNVETPEGTEIEVSFQVREGEQWSRWFSYGKWSSDGDRGSIKEQRDEIALMDIDTLTILEGKEIDRFKYSITMRRKSTNINSPKIKAIYATLRLSDSNSSVLLDEGKNWMVDLDIPKRSQMVVPEIGNIICSPTSLSMVMEYYGQKIETEEVAANVLDNGPEIYGNWSYNVAYAGSKGFIAYVERFASIDDIKDKIADGIPVIASIRTKSKEDLSGTSMAYPGGHLLVVRGFMKKDGEEYVIVNDPAAPDHETVRREYKLSEFEKAWSKIVYILKLDLK